MASKSCSPNPRLKGDDEPWLDITGVIGVTGSLSGAVALSLDQAAAEGLISELMGAAVAFDDADLPDAVGELTNIVSGSAKAKLNSCGTLSITCPTVTRGACVTRLVAGAEAPVVIDCECPVGNFRVEVCLQPAETVSDAAPSAAA